MDIRENNEREKVVVFWHNDNDLHVEIGGKTEIINAEDALNKYGDNREFMRKYKILMERNLEESLPDSLSMSIDSMLAERLSDKPSNQQAHSDGIIGLENYVKKFIGKTSGSNIDSFKNQYGILVNQLKYDEKFAEDAKQQDRMAGLSAWEATRKDIERTKTEKRGVCTTFTFRIQDELENLGIENYPLVISKPDLIHWANLYVVDGEFYVCDITRDIIFGENLPLIPSVSVQIPLSQYMQDNPNATFLIPDKVIDNGIKMHELSTVDLQRFIMMRESIITNQYSDEHANVSTNEDFKIK